MAVTPPRPLAEDDDRDASIAAGNPSTPGSVVTPGPTRQAAPRASTSSRGASGRIVGYVTLSAAQIERAFLPRPQQRNRPDPVPATLLGQLAVDKDYQGQGHAASLLLFALRTALRAAEIVGSTASSRTRSMTACAASTRDGGFQDLPFDPRRAMFVRDGRFAAGVSDVGLARSKDPACHVGIRG